MDGPLLTDWLQAGAAIVTMFAALAALIVALGAPKAAAKWAELYRNQSEKASERERLRMSVFVSLMKCRRTILHGDAIAALNLVDVAFADVKEVRDAHNSFVRATLEENENATKIIERYHVLIEKIAQAMGVGDNISVFDIQSGYYPTALGKIDEAALVDAEEKLARKAAAQTVGPA